MANGGQARLSLSTGWCRVACIIIPGGELRGVVVEIGCGFRAQFVPAPVAPGSDATECTYLSLSMRFLNSAIQHVVITKSQNLTQLRFEKLKKLYN